MAYIDKKTGKLIYNKITSNEVVQANYLASNQDEHHVDDVINIYTMLMPWNYGTPPCSHTEIGFWVDGELWFFSSTSRKELGSSSSKKNGTRWIKAEEMLRNPDRWLLQVKHVESIGDRSLSISRANRLVRSAYDFYGVFADFTNPYRVLCNGKYVPLEDIAKIKKIYCSKAVELVDTGRLRVMSPKRRFKVAKKLGYVAVDNTEEYMKDKGIKNEN